MKTNIAWVVDRVSAKVLLALLLAGLAVLFVARPSDRVFAATTQVFVTPAGRVNPETIVTFFNGPTQSVDVRVKDVQYATGLGAFEFTLTFNPSVASVLSVTQGPFLGSTLRSVSCTTPVIAPGSVNYSCATIGATPNGPNGSGVLATITFAPGAIGSTNIAFTKSHLDDITGTVPLPHQAPKDGLPSGALLVAKCGDFNADSVVTIGDILLMILRFGTNTGSPNWDPRFDLTNDGHITIGDMTIEVQEFGRACTA